MQDPIYGCVAHIYALQHQVNFYVVTMILNCNCSCVVNLYIAPKCGKI
jgi:hypothetical protein